MILFLDTETRSRIPLKHGTVKYATQAEVIIATWAEGYGKVRRHDFTREPTPPPDLLDAIVEADEIWAHNSFFDRTVLAGESWWRDLQVPATKWRCLMACALSHGLPGGLDKLCDIFKVPQDEAKQKDGKELIQVFCKPAKKGAYNDRHSHPAEWKRFLAYAESDITAMQAILPKIPKWNYGSSTLAGVRELACWHLDQAINSRGFAVDVAFAEAAVRATTEAKEALALRTQELTEGEVQRATQRDKLLQHLLAEYGVSLPDLKADTLERRLEDPELPEFVKELLRIRLQASKASTSKYKRICEMQVAGRMYGTLQFAGANRTARWGGRGFQPHNQPRPTHKWPAIQTGIEAFKNGSVTLIEDNVMELASSCIRSVIVAPKGKKIVQSDLSNIEGRMAAWIAGEEWKVQAFADFDAGIGQDLYKVSYGRSFDISPDLVEDDSDERQIGKVQELSLQYQGGVNAFVTMASTYGIDLDELAEKAWPTIPTSVRMDAQSVWQWAVKKRRTYGLSEKVYVVCEALKRMWRDAHPNISSIWEGIEESARCAIMNPGKKFELNMLTFVRQGEWLYIKLPSGRLLCYPQPRVDNGRISYMGVNAYSKQWHRISTYGGKLFENIVQAASRDVLAESMPHAEAAGYLITCTVHDEIISEVPDTSAFTAVGLSRILATNSDWNIGLPLAAKGIETPRYRKA